MDEDLDTLFAKEMYLINVHYDKEEIGKKACVMKSHCLKNL